MGTIRRKMTPDEHKELERDFEEARYEDFKYLWGATDSIIDWSWHPDSVARCKAQELNSGWENSTSYAKISPWD